MFGYGVGIDLTMGRGNSAMSDVVEQEALDMESEFDAEGNAIPKTHSDRNSACAERMVAFRAVW